MLEKRRTGPDERALVILGGNMIRMFRKLRIAYLAWQVQRLQREHDKLRKVLFD
jgi:hypothetical protein